ncbi:MAG: hypothetical protein AAFU67_08165, partial [Bacteroidota bacterium]
MPLRFFFILLFCFFLNSITAKVALTLFTDGPVDRILLKQQLNYVSHTLDPNTTQVHLLITRQNLGIRGTVYQYAFTGREDLAGNQLSFQVAISPNLTQLEVAQTLINRLELGLMGFIAGTDYAPMVNLDFINEDTLATVSDGPEEPLGNNWNNWIFEIFSNVSFQRESLRKTSDLRLGMRIDRS